MKTKLIPLRAQIQFPLEGGAASIFAVLIQTREYGPHFTPAVAPERYLYLRMRMPNAKKRMDRGQEPFQDFEIGVAGLDSTLAEGEFFIHEESSLKLRIAAVLYRHGLLTPTHKVYHFKDKAAGVQHSACLNDRMLDYDNAEQS